ncbi:MAG TPA: anti-phage dCTP deaminase [Herbaspirillum sp.]|uniref:anti-phage dCTP deaminase n=1 Tax=Herbaspirillum sp. TaxID=1890675 RepID=UPI002D6868C4|nr:anti-phage dCTP deaminase [Herbaspirillum sp.]HZG20431.1 anti-phage dCTP deaminase [Herbaspirillum sp.]
MKKKNETKTANKRPTTKLSKRSEQEEVSLLDDSTSIANPLAPRLHPELVFGLVGPVGVSLDPVISVLSRELKALKYSASAIRLSKLIENFLGSDHSKESEEKRITNLMDEGTRLREQSGRGDAVALLSIAEIRRTREEDLDKKFERHAYILRSLKHPDEVEALRNVYGKGFYLISVYSPREVRVNALAERISKSKFGRGASARSHSENIVERDEQEESTSLGQDVKDAFPLADLFVDSRNRTTLEFQITRFIQLIFGNVFHTPSRDEQGMYHARAAALRSSDLNRQVGAAILRAEGDLVAIGCNDVPKAGGDLYWPGDLGDARDFQKGIDAMAEERVQVLGELLERFESEGMFSTTIKKDHLNQLVRDLVSGPKKSVLKGTRVMNLLEFGRSVHAEMAALMSAARVGTAVRNSTLFCTTFPCHMCARHIVASGIKRVVYIEPYPKSKAKHLHQDSISVDPSAPSADHVNFEPFEGVAPRQYQDLFDARDSRKDSEGRALDWRAKRTTPRFSRFLNTYREIEIALVYKELPLMAQKLNINLSLPLDDASVKEVL